MGIREGRGPPIDLIANAERLQRAKQRPIAGQRAVIKLLKRPSPMLKEGAETSELVRAFVNRDAVPGLSEAKRTGEAGNAAAEDGD